MTYVTHSTRPGHLRSGSKAGLVISLLPSQVHRIAVGLLHLSRYVALFLLVFGLVGGVRAAQYPLILVHGLNGGAFSWDDMKDVLIKNGYVWGGSPYVDKDTTLVKGTKTVDPTRPMFYTLAFSDNNELYISQQAAELKLIINEVKRLNNTSKVALAAHSMGGLAARAYLQNLAYDQRFFQQLTMQAQKQAWQYANDVDALITVGTPHDGSDLAGMEGWWPSCFVTCIARSELSLTSVSLANLNKGLFAGAKLVGAPPYPSGWIETVATSRYMLPSDLRYRTIIVTGWNSAGNSFLNNDGDGVVTYLSQDLLRIFANSAPRSFSSTVVNFSELAYSVLIPRPILGVPAIPALGEVHLWEPGNNEIQSEIVTFLWNSSSTDVRTDVVTGLQGSPSPAATLTGTVSYGFTNPTTHFSKVWFDFGPTPTSLGTPVSAQIAQSLFQWIGKVEAQAPSLTVGGTYYYRLGAQDSNGLWYGEIRKFTVPTGAVLDVPRLGVPIDRAVGQSVTPTFSWETISGATYRIMIAGDPLSLPTNPSEDACPGCVVNLEVSTASYTPPAGTLNQGTPYYWQVKAKLAGKYSQWSQRRAFTTAYAPSTVLPAPTLTAPADGSTVQTTQPTFTWTAVTSATSYRIMVSEDPLSMPTDSTSAACDACVVNDVSNGTVYTPPPSKLVAGKTYYWQVKARSPVSYGYWSEYRALSVTEGAGTAISVKPQVAAFGYSLALKADGTVWWWGSCACSQGPSSVAVQVAGLTGVAAVTESTNTTLVLKSDRTVWAWGLNVRGMFGNGTTVGSAVPVQSSITDVISLSALLYHAIALKSDGTVWAWGWNNGGQLGNGTTVDSILPVQVSGMNQVVAVAAGDGASVALKSDGTVWEWGVMYSRDGTWTKLAIPVQVEALTGVVGVAAGGNQTVALKADGTVWAWGNNLYGELGNGTSTNSSVPIQVQGLTGVVSVVAAEYNTMALKSDGTVWAWGLNYDGNWSNASGSISSTPVQIAGLNSVEALAAGWGFGLALKSDGTVWAWGLNAAGSLGNGTTTNSSVPVQVVVQGGQGLNLGPPTSAKTPTAPIIGKATAGNARATVSFTAPTNNGGSAITGYTVISSPGGITATGIVSPITVIGLTNGTSYTFTVKATNSMGTGIASAPSNIVTPVAPAAANPDCLFNWAERVYPNLFAPAGAVSQTLAPYYYRYYSQTGAYLGTSSADNHVYYRGPMSSDATLNAGAMSTWLATAGCQ